MLKRFILLKSIVNDLTTNADMVPNLSAAQQLKLNELCFNVEEWALISVLSKMLRPFYDATIHLQKTKFPLLSNAKLIESSLFEYFNNMIESSSNELEIWISECFVENLNRYLDHNLTLTDKQTTETQVN
jgi:hypothetical protein